MPIPIIYGGLNLGKLKHVIYEYINNPSGRNSLIDTTNTTSAGGWIAPETYVYLSGTWGTALSIGAPYSSTSPTAYTCEFSITNNGTDVLLLSDIGASLYVNNGGAVTVPELATVNVIIPPGGTVNCKLIGQAPYLVAEVYDTSGNLINRGQVYYGGTDVKPYYINTTLTLTNPPITLATITNGIPASAYTASPPIGHVSTLDTTSTTIIQTSTISISTTYNKILSSVWFYNNESIDYVDVEVYDAVSGNLIDSGSLGDILNANSNSSIYFKYILNPNPNGYYSIAGFTNLLYY